MVKLDLEMLVLWREENWRTQKKNPWSKARTKNKLNPHMVPGQNWTLVALVGSKCSHHCAIPAPCSKFFCCFLLHSRMISRKINCSITRSIFACSYFRGTFPSISSFKNCFQLTLFKDFRIFHISGSQIENLVYKLKAWHRNTTVLVDKNFK